MQHYVEEGYNADEMENIFNTSAHILRGWHVTDKWGSHDYLCRGWHRREQDKYPLHPVVKKAMRMSRPDDWQLLLLQWPHQSMTDQSRLAYTRDEKAGEADKQVITSIGKYLRAHFSRLPDHAIRDLVATNTVADFKFVHTTAEMLYHLHKGPRSCMVWDGYDPDDMTSHPYMTYDPALGWHMAVRIVDGDTVGRALCNTDDEGTKYFVRSYKKDPNHGYSHADEELNAWLRELGYVKYSGYPEGTKLKLIPTRRNDAGFIAPYIDGDIQHVDACGDHLVICENGDWECNSTDGNPADSSGDVCEDCDNRIREGDGYWAGRWEDRRICTSCCEYSYHYAHGANGNQYYEHQDDCVYSDAEAEWYVADYLSSNGMVELENGSIVSIDDAVCIGDYWYDLEDDRIVCDHEGCYQMLDDCVQLHNGEYCLQDDAWECAASNEWFANDDVEPVVIEGETYHPDNVPEQDSETAE